jgi:hypothetical protein
LQIDDATGRHAARHDEIIVDHEEIRRRSRRHGNDVRSTKERRRHVAMRDSAEVEQVSS